jgi:hypothetical protein
MVLMTLIEMDAQSLLLQAPVLGLGLSSDAEALRYRFEAEFSLLGSNIRNVFEAIRLGYVSPAEAPALVEGLMGLSERGKLRLMDAAIHSGDEATVRFDRAVRAFGRLWTPGDLQVSVIRGTPPSSVSGGSPSGGESVPGVLRIYSQMERDRDGMLRRIRPLLRGGEHIALAALKGKTGGAEIRHTGKGTELLIQGLMNQGEGELVLPLDREGAALLDFPQDPDAFRRFPLSTFVDYGDRERELLEAMKDAAALGIYDSLPPEAAPPALYDYTERLREDFLEDPNPQRKSRWLNSRDSFFAALENFLYGPVEMRIIAGYEDLLAAGDMGESGRAEIRGLRDRIIRCFVDLRVGYHGLVEIRSSLTAGIAGAWCILGPLSPPETPEQERLGGRIPPRREATDSEVSAALINGIQGRSFIPLSQDRTILLCSLLTALAGILLLGRFGALTAACIALLYSALSFTGFSLAFVFSRCWLDPLIPLAGAASGTFSAVLFTAILEGRTARRFRAAYGGAVSRSTLRTLIRVGQPEPEESIRSQAVIVSIRNPALLGKENLRNPQSLGEMIGRFRAETAAAFTDSGAVVLAWDEDMVLAAFGSPLERIAAAARGAGEFDRPQRLLQRALSTAESIIGDLPWSCGIDLGECAFTCNPVYTAFGRPTLRSRTLARLCTRINVRTLITAQAEALLEAAAGEEHRFQLWHLSPEDADPGQEAVYSHQCPHRGFHRVPRD